MRKFVRPLLAAMCGMFLITPIVKAQEATPAGAIPAVSLGENVTMKIGGFLRADAYFDTRKNAEAVDGLFNFYPLSENLDKNGKDINAISQYRMSATASRLNARFSGPDVFNAKSSSLIEFDFTGFDGIGLRLRHAWIKLSWEKSELLFGRFWHPLMALDVLPNVVALSTGAPFKVFNRCEQIRYSMKFGQLSAYGALSTQMKYGFNSKFNSTTGDKLFYQGQSYPDFSLNLQFKNEFLIIGATGNIKNNLPFTDLAGKYKIEDKVVSKAVAAYAQLTISDLKIKGGAMYGQNMHEFLMVGGYAIESIPADSSSIKYATANTMNYWGNIVYGKELQFSVFFGYLKNMGTSSKTIIPKGYYGRGENIDNSIRIAPSISYKTGRLLYQLELEHNIAAYGSLINPDLTPTTNHKVVNAKNISNTRVQLAATFFF